MMAELRDAMQPCEVVPLSVFGRFLPRTPRRDDQAVAVQVAFISSAMVRSRTSAPVADLRNLTQHIDTEIPDLVADQLPVWGALSWYVPAMYLADCAHDGAVFTITSGMFLDSRYGLLQPERGGNTRQLISSLSKPGPSWCRLPTFTQRCAK